MPLSLSGLILAALFIAIPGKVCWAADDMPLLVVAVDASLGDQNIRKAQIAGRLVAQTAQSNGQNVAVIVFGQVIENVVSAQSVTEETLAEIDELLAGVSTTLAASNLAVGIERSLSEVEDRRSHLMVFASPGTVSQLSDEQSDQYQWLVKILLPQAESAGVSMSLVTQTDSLNLDPVFLNAMNALPYFNLLNIDNDMFSTINTSFANLAASSAEASTPVVAGEVSSGNTSGNTSQSPITLATLSEPDKPVSDSQPQPAANSAPQTTVLAARRSPWIMWLGVGLVVAGLLLVLVTLYKRYSAGKQAVSAAEQLAALRRSTRVSRRSAGDPSRRQQSDRTNPSTPSTVGDTGDPYLPIDLSTTQRFGQAAVKAATVITPATGRTIQAAQHDDPVVDHEAVTVLVDAHQKDPDDSFATSSAMDDEDSFLSGKTQIKPQD